MDPEPNEYSKSGTDDSSAANEEAAFDPNITDPQEAKDKAGEGNAVNPLDASPANPEISKGTAEEEGGSKKKLSEGGGGR
jgi:predicted component of type VI protein secretion system